MADYLEGIEEYPVRSQVKPGEIYAALPDAAPAAAEPMDAIFRDFQDIVMPGITHWQHPSFFAYFPGNSSPPSVLAEMLTATLSAQCMLWQTSPAASEMEARVLDWLRQMIALPESFTGVIQDSATSSTLVALLTARERATGWQGNDKGLSEFGKLTVYTSAEAHSSVEKGARVAGYGAENVRKVPVDADFAMDVEKLEYMIEADRADGLIPSIVVGTLGATGTGGMDPMNAIADIAERHGLWFHVDAAWAGSAMVLPEQQHLMAGAERADSFVFNPHKWFFTNFDVSAYFVRDTDALDKTLSLIPEYLRTTVGGGADVPGVVDYQNWSVPLGRRFRALKLWFVIRSYGVDGLRDMLRSHIELAAGLHDNVAAHPDFEIMSPVRLAMFSFRYRREGVTDDALDDLNERLLETLNDSGKLYLTRNKVHGALAIRFVIGQTYTEQRHIDAAWAQIQEVAKQIEFARS